MDSLQGWLSRTFRRSRRPADQAEKDEEERIVLEPALEDARAAR
jgi:hypothetical protein